MHLELAELAHHVTPARVVETVDVEHPVQVIGLVLEDPRQETLRHDVERFAVQIAADQAAAVRKQAPIVVRNLLALRDGREPSGRYDGYGSCPLIVGYGKVILAEFGYDGRVTPSFPLDPTIPRRSMWYF